jgi:hypothetical protein
MKKIVLTLPALLIVSLATAQSYAKQPDPSTYEVVEYKPAKQPQAETPVATVQNKNTQQAPAKPVENENTTAPKDGSQPQPEAAPQTEMQNRKRR